MALLGAAVPLLAVAGVSPEVDGDPSGRVVQQSASPPGSGAVAAHGDFALAASLLALVPRASAILTAGTEAPSYSADASARLPGEGGPGAPEFVLRNADNPDEVYYFGAFHKYAYLAGTPLKWATTISWRYNPEGQPPHFSDDEVLTALQAATAKWEAVCNVDFSYAGTTSTSPSEPGCDGQAVVGWAPLSGSTVGWTTACWSGATLNQFDTLLDNQEPYQLNSLGLLQKVALHEFGHALGLGHTSVSLAVMNASVTTGTLAQDDIDGCVSLYGAAAGASIRRYKPWGGIVRP